MAKAKRNVKTDNSKVYDREEEIVSERNRKFKIFLLVLMIIIGLAAIFAFIKIYSPNIFGKASLSGELAATVNGKQITMSELNAAFDKLPAQYKLFVSKEQLLSQLIDESLLVDEAAKQKIAVGDADIDTSLNQFMSQNNLTQEQFNAILQNRSISNADLRLMIRNQLLVTDLIDKEVYSKINVTSNDLVNYYNNNSQLFKVPEMITARHILISTGNRSDANASKLADDVLAKIKPDKSNFCDLVTQYSEDPGSVPKCGEYTFSRGQMVPEFENKSFDQKDGMIGIAKTEYGYHIIWTVNRTAPTIINFKDVQDQIKAVVLKQEQNNGYDAYLAKLRSAATIINYLTGEGVAKKNTTVVQESQSAVPAASQNQATQSTVTIVASNKTGEAAVPTTSTGANPTETTSAPIEPAATENIPAVAQTTPPVTTGSLDCFFGKAILYGAYWDSSTKKQLDSFGSDASKLKYVECGVQGDYSTQSDACKKAGISAYPTWVISGKQLIGVYSQDELINRAGC